MSTAHDPASATKGLALAAQVLDELGLGDETANGARRMPQGARSSSEATRPREWNIRVPTGRQCGADRGRE